MSNAIYGDFVLIVDGQFKAQNAVLGKLFELLPDIDRTRAPQHIEIKRHIMGIATLCGHKEFGHTGGCAEITCFNYVRRHDNKLRS